MMHITHNIANGLVGAVEIFDEAVDGLQVVGRYVWQSTYVDQAV